MLAVKLQVIMMAFLYSPLAYFLLRKLSESNREIKIKCIGGVVPTEWLFQSTCCTHGQYHFSPVLRARVVTPFCLNRGTWN